MQSITKSKKYEILSIYKNQQQSVYVFCYFFSSRSKNAGTIKPDLLFASLFS